MTAVAPELPQQDARAVDLAGLDTPCLVLDRSALARNTARMTGRFQDIGVDLRPHMKTAKSVEVARMALDGNFGGITVSTLKEAEYFAANGIVDITYAVSVIPERMPRIAALARNGARLTVVTDNAAVAAETGRRAEAFGLVLDALVEIDSGEARSGVSADSDALLEIGKALASQSGTRLRGVLTHAGHSYRGRSIAEMEQFAEHERQCAVTGAERLRAAGLPCDVVSVGSTPTAVHGRSFAGVTEVRCGVYMFGDVFQAEIGSHAINDIATSVLATVIGHRPDLNSALIDAGALALSKDRSTGAPGLREDIGFGLVVDARTGARIDHIRVGHVYQEHGLLVGERESPFPYERLPISSQVRVLPNHACLTAAMYDTYQVFDFPETSRAAVWHRVNGW
jgi:D-serine deaminase-like pyridoxal phosphate-dependent protein